MQSISPEFVRMLQVDGDNVALREYSRLEFGRPDYRWLLPAFETGGPPGLALRERLSSAAKRLRAWLAERRSGCASQELAHVGAAPLVSMLPVVLADADAAGHEKEAHPGASRFFLRGEKEA